ncbi:dephospho-CoA kinase [Marinicrinis sediminis]|uniref:Dephospho-CoA kinase n=1 Tax=Marinicrinis sediminis TaxID=1652465 RepID=A0ABW5RAT8_9BACL
MNIGLTGGIACGKSTVANMLVEGGAVLVDADQIAREVVLPGSSVLQEIEARFGADILDEYGSLKRKELGKIVFQDDQARKALEDIMHPAIRALMKARMEELEQADPNRLVVVDVPLLYESDLVHLFENVMVVYIPTTLQLKRLMDRDGLDEAAARQRLQAQMPIEEKKRRADFVIDNQGTLVQTREQVIAYLNEWKPKI